jgi:antitoxin component YwqK of YwqJK toxin-antitoxin module
LNNQVKYHSNKYKINVIVFFSATLFAAILSILIFKCKEVHQNQHKNNLVFKDGLIYVEEESIPFSGRMFDTLDNKMMVEYDVVNGLKNGEFFLFSVSGKLKAYGFMENNKNTGPWEYYYENGQLECTGEFNADKPGGKWFWYYENGMKKCEGIYLKGIPGGNWMKYDKDGYPESVIKYYSGEALSIVEIQKPKMI